MGVVSLGIDRTISFVDNIRGIDIFTGDSFNSTVVYLYDTPSVPVSSVLCGGVSNKFGVFDVADGGRSGYIYCSAIRCRVVVEDGIFNAIDTGICLIYIKSTTNA